MQPRQSDGRSPSPCPAGGDYKPWASDSLSSLPVPLFPTTRDRERHRQDQDLYAVLVECEHLERQHLREAISEAVYLRRVHRLFRRFDSLCQVGRLDPQAVTAFAKRYRLVWSNARHRLLEAGPPPIPASMDEGFRGGPSSTRSMGAVPASSGSGRIRSMPQPALGGASHRLVATAVRHFCSTTDLLAISLYGVNNLLPSMSGLVSTLRSLAPASEARPCQQKLEVWYAFSSNPGMDEGSSLSQPQARQLELDLEAAYQEFQAALDGY